MAYNLLSLLKIPAGRWRWRIPLAGFLLALMGGFAYAWGVLVPPLMERFGWTKAEAVMPFTVFLVVFALVMVPAGRLQDRYGPRVISAVGAVLFMVAYGLAAMVGTYPHAWWLVLSYGVIGGAACGLTYACVAPAAHKWFPDRPGFAVSTAVMGFGLAALIVAPIKTEYLLIVHGIEGTFLIIGGLSMVVCLLASWMIDNPPKDWAPPNWKPGLKATGAKATELDFTPREIIGTSLFWMIWVMMVSVTSGGFIAIGFVPAYGISIGLSATDAAVAIAIFAAFNGFGRPVAGYLADHYGTIPVMLITYVIQAATLLTFPVIAITLPGLYLYSALLGWGFAVTLGLFPVLTSSFFGVKHPGANYGLVFTAFGAGALAPTLGSWIYDQTGGYAPAFIISGILACLGLILSVVIRKQYSSHGGQKKIVSILPNNQERITQVAPRNGNRQLEEEIWHPDG